MDTSSPQLPPNWQHLSGSFYMVRTQAGFRNALRHYLEGEGLDCRGYPRTYPAMVCFSHGYNGSIYVRADVIHVKAVKAAIEKA